MASTTESVRCFEQKKMAIVVTHCKQGRRLIKIKGVPIKLVQPEILRYKAFEPILLLRRHQFFGVDEDPCQAWWSHLPNIRYRSVHREALVAFYQKYLDEQSKNEMKNILVR
ncbi:40S ribosomal S16-like [Olea europaea subsp. europaea]|uniref:40S ribosomal S16-like n=1 Tax=Olea europaea subsp. europaea TaxID=158383 RepID=A0A8S0U1R8_OLEEU|nr:40S ribosomal S16-like [Olea europaea subsp. europaea]